MEVKIIHLSDIHFSKGWYEEHGVVFKSFLDDLKKQVDKFGDAEKYIVISGDVVMKGESEEQYEDFFVQFSEFFTEIGVPMEKRICVPGNHDVALSWITENKINHDCVVAKKFTETEFNDYIKSRTCILFEKFKKYLEFEGEFCSIGVRGNVSGRGWDLDGGLGVYCLNTSLNASGSSQQDKGRLMIDTRNLNRWIGDSSSKTKIIVMHHPLSWLCEWSRAELETTIFKNFSLLLSGHEHDQSIFHSTSVEGEAVLVSAPPLFTCKRGDLGYSYITLDESGVVDISYRQKTSRNTFVSGVNYSDNDTGKVVFIDKDDDSLSEGDPKIDVVLQKFKGELEASLRSFSDQPSVWVDPELYTIDEKRSSEKRFDAESKEENKVNIDNFIAHPDYSIVSAPAQFGLSSLSAYFRFKAWEKGKLWVIIDTDTVKPNKLLEEISKQSLAVGLGVGNVSCVIFDSWESSKSNSKKIKKYTEEFPGVPAILMRTLSDNFFKISLDVDSGVGIVFNNLFLHSLPKSKVREIVCQYNIQREIADDDLVLNKIISDLDVLNLHRTPLNCITLLHVMEDKFDDNPVNRTEVIRRILFLLFNFDSVPSYKRRPDMKDCENILGWFCKKLIMDNNLTFSRENFFGEIRRFCKENIIDIEIGVLFDILYDNNIVVSKGDLFCFKFTYWVMFFSAQRMHHDDDFKNHVLGNMRYSSYPELIEFYTGIDRRRDDALEVLLDDLESTYDQVSKRLGFPEGVDPYSMARWNPTEDTIEKIKGELESEVDGSNLPDTIKDEFSDRAYDPQAPYNQDLKSIATDYMLENLTQVVTAASRALRNSDFASANFKRKLLVSILRSWSLLTKVLVVLSPILARDGSASFEGTNFVVTGLGKSNTISHQERFYKIFQCIPENVLYWNMDDLYSHKMSPLLFDQIRNDKAFLARHYLVLILIEKRPHNWRAEVEKYISSVHKNSFYLLDVANALANTQRYGYLTKSLINDYIYLRKMALAKHQFGIKRPGKKVLGKVQLNDE